MGTLLVVLGLPLLIAQKLKGGTPNPLQSRLGAILIFAGLLFAMLDLVGFF
jgi:hypothetical protein